MKTLVSSLVMAALAVVTYSVEAQETLIFDQQSSMIETPPPFPTGSLLQGGRAGQSFTPSLASIDFIRLKLGDGDKGNSVGATIYLMLRSDGVDGPVIASTDPVVLADGFLGVAHFSFAETVPLMPGQTYVFEPSITAESDAWGLDSWAYQYSGGVAYFNGVANPASDIWFREGIVAVPEASSLLLGLIGVGVLVVGRRALQPARAS